MALKSVIFVSGSWGRVLCTAGGSNVLGGVTFLIFDGFTTPPLKSWFISLSGVGDFPLNIGFVAGFFGGVTARLLTALNGGLCGLATSFCCRNMFCCGLQ